MTEKSEKIPTESTVMRKNGLNTNDSFVDDDMEVYPTAKLQTVQPKELRKITETPVPVPAHYVKGVSEKMVAGSGKINMRETAIAHSLLEQCRQLCLSLFARESHPVRSLGVYQFYGR